VKSPDRDRIREAVTARREQILDWTRKLVAFPSENRPPDGAEAGAQEFLAGECRAMGWDVELSIPTETPGAEAHPYWLPHRNYPAGRCDLAARWKGRGGGKSLLFSGHVDVAPFEPDNWRICRPYEPRVMDGRLYGRGTADMKGGLAAAYWAMRVLREEGFSPAGDLLYESVVDEEFAGGNGTLSARLRGFNADLAVLSEPTRMQVCPACLGAFLGDISIRGKAGMPFMGTAIPNPLFAASRVISLFREWEQHWRALNSHALFQEPGKELNVVLSSLSTTIPGEFTQMGTPLIARISWIIWCHPGMTEHRFYQELRRFWEPRFASDPELAPFTIDLAPTYHYVRAWETPSADPGVQTAVDAFTAMTGSRPVIGGAPFSCDLGVYGDPGGMPCLILGPRGDNLHAPDEWVLIEDIYSLAEIFADLAVRWTAGP
jgi:acetylornithine deacetylase